MGPVPWPNGARGKATAPNKSLTFQAVLWPSVDMNSP